MIAPEHLYEYRARVTGVYDGDTVTVDIDLGFKTWVKDEKIRLLGIDAPELKGETLQAGRASRDALRELILDEDVLIRTEKDEQGSFGRYLGEVFVETETGEFESVNQILLDRGLAERWRG